MPDASPADRSIIFGVSGASGAMLADATARALLERQIPLDVVCSDFGELMWQKELDEQFKEATARWAAIGPVTVHRPNDVAAPISSGSYPVRGMVIVPCSVATVGSIATGVGRNLLHRAADVTLKEKRPCVIVPRETPLSLIHLRNMTSLAEAGAVILPPVPAFYLKPGDIGELVEALAQRILQSLGVLDEIDPAYRWT